MRSEPLSLKHKDLLQPLLKSLNLCLSEYSFSSRFVFRHMNHYEVLFDRDFVWIRGKTKDGVTHLIPTQDIRNMKMEDLLIPLQWADCYFPIPESWLPSFDPNVFQHSFNRDDSDYIFKRTNIAEYPGRNLSAKRNLLKQFLAAHTPRVVPYSKELLADALFILDSWQNAMGSLKTDYEACKDGLELSQELGFSGYLVYADEKPAAFILGEIYRNTLFVIHFAKAIIDYKGIYPFLFKELASQLDPEDICCLNWEEDLGQEGLRKSKLSYQPEKLAHKYRLFAKK
ncbi:MAG: DUF2156 domain-containing protein [Verrucomicrobia bacterium]|nr:DUF2156 domain-containing protein [Verrucomicrobiota bacterium]